MLKRILFVVALGVFAAAIPGCAQSQKGGDAVGCECTGEADCSCGGKTVDDCKCK